MTRKLNTGLAGIFLVVLAAAPATATEIEFHEDGVLIPSGLDAHDVAGYAVEVDGDTMAVGSHVSSSDGLGFDLALDGDRLVIGSGYDESGAMSSGSVYVFERARSSGRASPDRRSPSKATASRSVARSTPLPTPVPTRARSRCGSGRRVAGSSTHC